MTDNFWRELFPQAGRRSIAPEILSDAWGRQTAIPHTQALARRAAQRSSRIIIWPKLQVQQCALRSFLKPQHRLPYSWVPQASSLQP